MMQRMNIEEENKRSFRTERKAGQECWTGHLQSEKRTGRSQSEKCTEARKIKKYEQYVPGVQTLWWLSVPGHSI